MRKFSSMGRSLLWWIMAGLAVCVPGLVNAQVRPTAASEPSVQAAPAEQAAPTESSVPAAGSVSAEDVLNVQGEYDIEELKRLVEVARESGFTEEQLQQITVEDINGNVINALAFIKVYEERQRQMAMQDAALRAKVYLSPKDILQELDSKQPQDLDRLRDRMLFVE